MPDGSVALSAPGEASAEDRLLAALLREGLRASRAEAEAQDGWFLFDTPAGPGAFRPASLGGLAVPPAEEAHGAAAADQVAKAEAVLALAERALGVAIEPRAVGPAPDGLCVGVERDEDVVLLRVPEALALSLPPGDAPSGSVVHRVRLAAPALDPAEIPGPGDLLILGGRAPCEVAPARPHGAAAFAATIGLPGDEVPAVAPGAGGVVAFETLLTPAQADALRAGAILAITEGEAPPGRYASGESARTGRLVAVGRTLAFRFD